MRVESSFDTTEVPERFAQAEDCIPIKIELQMQRRVWNSSKHVIIDAILWCALAVLMVISALNLSAIRSHSAVSLRYKTAVSGQAAWQARRYAANQSSEYTFWPTFWHEVRSSVAGDFSKSDAKCIYYNGNASLVWAADYLSGTTPGVTDGLGCTVSSALAWKLWGSFDIIGKTVEVDGVSRTIRGVFKGDDLVALLSIRDEDKSQSYTGVELSGGPSSPSRDDVVSFTMVSGLGAPDNILKATPAFLAGILSALPLLGLAVYGFALLIGSLKKYPATLRWALILTFIAFALMLPILLDALPDWIIPTRWSDFSFWGSLAGRIGDDLKEYLAVEPRLRDVVYKTLIIKQVVVAFMGIITTIVVCFRWHIKLLNGKLQKAPDNDISRLFGSPS